MNELIIDDKKYIPSKQAAKITGYAKDYVGQLCREGRVPARLVGRSWYVLESAIKDHRFGTHNSEEGPDIGNVPMESKAPSTHAWGDVRYESSKTETIPPVGHSKVIPESEIESENIAHNLNDAWREWFSRVTGSIPSSETILPDTEIVNEPKEEHKGEGQRSVEPDVEENVPLHILRPEGDSLEMARNIASTDNFPIERELDLTATSEEAVLAPSDSERTIENSRTKRRSNKTTPLQARVRALIKVSSAVLILVAVIVAFLGSDYSGTYATSNTQASVLSGVSMYER